MMEFLHAVAKLLFYAGVVFFLFFELIVTFSPRKTLAVHEYNDAALATLEAEREANPEYKEPEKKWDDKNYFEREAYARGIFNSLYLVWCFLGLITGNWFVFAVVILLGVITGVLPKSVKRTATYVVLDGSLCLALLCFTLVNAYQLHLGWRDLLHFIW